MKTAARSSGRTASDIRSVRDDFPILQRQVRGKPLVYLDNAATSQKPSQVIETLSRYYRSQNANIHRGVYYLSERATADYEAARVRAQRFLNAAQPEEVVFVRGATEAINLVVGSYGRSVLRSGDEVLISAMEHHSNIVPWQILCEAVGARLRVAPIDRAGTLPVDEFERALSPRTKIVAVVHVSNSLGTINPVKQLVSLAKESGAVVLVDGAQAAPHMQVDVQQLGCDFYTVSGHKMYAPTGIGLLYGRGELLEAMPPYQGGGEMIRSVAFEKTTYAPPPAKFEAGTPHIAGALGLGAAIEYIEQIGWGFIHEREASLLEHALERLATVPGLRFVGSARERASVVSFVMDGIHAHDIGTIVDQEGVAIRTGHHCTQPVMDFFRVPATARASFAFYNTLDEVDVLVRALQEAREVFG
ncbi:MAG: cysteine desulfurase [Gemmatimonadota bacterium]|nr:MAG: cysteine desulfurase [Gemmatimonadota bacterium]